MRYFLPQSFLALFLALPSHLAWSTSLPEDPFEIIKKEKTLDEYHENCIKRDYHEGRKRNIIIIKNIENYTTPFTYTPEWKIEPEKNLSSQKRSFLKKWNNVVKDILTFKNYLSRRNLDFKKIQWISTDSILILKDKEINIGMWLEYQRKQFNKGILSEKKAKILDQLELSSHGRVYQPFSKPSKKTRLLSEKTAEKKEREAVQLPQPSEPFPPAQDDAQPLHSLYSSYPSFPLQQDFGFPTSSFFWVYPHSQTHPSVFNTFPFGGLSWMEQPLPLQGWTPSLNFSEENQNHPQ